MEQQTGRECEAQNVEHTATSNKANLTLDLAKAYPEEGHVKSWKRSITLVRGKRVDIRDEFELDKIITPIQLNFMTPLHVDVSVPGQITLVDSSRQFKLHYPAEDFQAEIENIPIVDARMSRSWENELYRIVLTATKTPLKGSINITLQE